jgi:hypothetical protein
MLHQNKKYITPKKKKKKVFQVRAATSDQTYSFHMGIEARRYKRKFTTC